MEGKPDSGQGRFCWLLFFYLYSSAVEQSYLKWSVSRWGGGARRRGNAQQNPGVYTQPAAELSFAAWQATSPMTEAFSAAPELWAEQQNKATPKLVSHAASSGGRWRTQAAQPWETFLCSALPGFCSHAIPPCRRGIGPPSCPGHSVKWQNPTAACGLCVGWVICLPLPCAVLSLTPLVCSGIWTVSVLAGH